MLAMCSCSNELRKGAGIVPMISTLSMKEETFLVLLKDPRVDLNEFYKDTTALGFVWTEPLSGRKQLASF